MNLVSWNVNGLRAAWKKRGFDLDLGIGITQGYATLGAVGFEGRWEYSCIGSVANLASRLCDEAESLARAREALARARAAWEAGAGGELAMVDVQESLDSLARLTGTSVHEEMLDRIFRQFCLGK